MGKILNFVISRNPQFLPFQIYFANEIFREISSKLCSSVPNKKICKDLKLHFFMPINNGLS